MKPNTKDRRRARILAMQALYQHRLAGTLAPELEAQFIADNVDKKVDMVYFRELLRPIFSNLDTLDQTITRYIDRDLPALDPISLSILRVSAYEIEHRIDIPYRVIINEGVELAKTYGATDSHKYINAVLDAMANDLRPHEKTACDRNSN